MNLEHVFFQVYRKLFTRKIVLLGCVALVGLVYMLNLFFGQNSLRVLLRLSQEEQALQKQIVFLQENNQNLLKKYFEYKNLEQ